MGAIRSIYTRAMAILGYDAEVGVLDVLATTSFPIR